MRDLSDRLSDLGLTRDPFAADAPLESLFPGAMRRASLDQMQLLARESDDIVALTGPAGSGKTLLGDFFARHADRDQVVARIRATLLTTPSQLLEDLFKAFVLDFPEQATLTELKASLQRYFAALHRQARTVVLIVDSAHELGDDALSLLTKLALNENHDGTFHLLLLGEPSLLDMLDYTCPMREGQPQFTAVQLPAFNLEETRAYLRYRLSAAGYQHDDGRALPFSNRQIERIHKLSGGVPAAINARASEMLGDVGLDLLELLPRLPADLPRSYVYGTAGALVLIVLAALLLGGDDAPELAQANLSEPVPIPLEPVPALRTVAETQDQATAGAATQPDAPAAGLATGIPVADGATTPAADPEPAAAPVASGSNSAPAVTAVAAATPTATPTPAAVSTPAPARAPAASTPAPAAAPARPAAAASTSDPTAPLASQHTRIRALPANQFTVQLLGSTSRANVEDFVRRHASSPLYWFETRNQGNPWFVVMMGAYPSRSAAQTAASGLTGELGRLEPWIRGIGTVQAEIVGGN